MLVPNRYQFFESVREILYRYRFGTGSEPALGTICSSLLETDCIAYMLLCAFCEVFFLEIVCYILGSCIMTLGMIFFFVNTLA
ncbi:hypothetical protein HanRHA438_Chr09g0426651 [Helianthus annuus]|uniref:Uncharacterized protein n=1 Tax=Helianthus annuus TaxID=4232 RepID=A0A251VKD8_HELAN|nr:hypothetical protein HanXRQr2_Chr09g0414431 [Helianthus annuus]KAJ0528020.1 hypothetical protein HanHA300_Chr09g0340581 [Helianthus annuus]KAJ0536872.1 hypothetical protein HanIR_Chr09g0446521 [Helianthus annuus]KAJ0544454.1 hypothetical protein HanHA89_Chr09g0361861 [Helianthus annuus]KAJ0709457.1 hypothetical protein HanLR1_Chr09g0340601 [Helianthus annuus]